MPTGNDLRSHPWDRSRPRTRPQPILTHSLIMSTDATVKGLEPSSEQFDGSKLRVAIVHARWNKSVIDSLVAGAVAKLKERGVLEQNIVIQTVPGSFELPFAVSK